MKKDVKHLSDKIVIFSLNIRKTLESLLKGRDLDLIWFKIGTIIRERWNNSWN